MLRPLMLYLANRLGVIGFIRRFTGNKELWMNEVLHKLLPAHPGTFLDVGINVGQTLVKIKEMDPYRQYVGFEPNPACIEVVTRLIRRRRYQNCIVLPAGLFTDDCIVSLDLFSADPTDSAASIVANFRPAEKVFSRSYVPVYRYESAVKSLKVGNVGLIKIDVEGAELEVIVGMADMIRRDRPAIILEVLPMRQDETRRKRQLELGAIILALEYTIFLINKTKKGRLSGLRRVNCFTSQSDIEQCDYLLVDAERASVAAIASVRWG